MGRGGARATAGRRDQSARLARPAPKGPRQPATIVRDHQPRFGSWHLFPPFGITSQDSVPGTFSHVFPRRHGGPGRTDRAEPDRAGGVSEERVPRVVLDDPQVLSGCPADHGLPRSRKGVQKRCQEPGPEKVSGTDFLRVHSFSWPAFGPEREFEAKFRGGALLPDAFAQGAAAGNAGSDGVLFLRGLRAVYQTEPVARTIHGPVGKLGPFPCGLSVPAEHRSPIGRASTCDAPHVARRRR